MAVCVVSPVTEIVRLACRRSPRVALLTDLVSPDGLPESIHGVADEFYYGNLSWINRSKIPSNLDGALIWCKDEVPMAGSTAEWRRPYFSKDMGNSLVAVHWPYLEHADLLGLEPRILRSQAAEVVWNPALRIAGSTPSEKKKTAWRASGKAWARLSLALWQEFEKPGSGMDSLLELWKATAGDPLLSSLVLRNLIVVLMKCCKWEKAGELLSLGTDAFPGGAEFPYLHAVYFLLQNSPAKAVRFLEIALGCGGREFVGSGGENSYRARYLLGLICDRIGQQEKAIQYWLPGVLEQPAFAPAVHALAAQRLPRGKARFLHHPLAEMARREPVYLESVVEFLIANDIARGAQRLVETISIDADRREHLLGLLAQAQARRTPQPRKPIVKPGILLTGPIFDASGHSRINRAIGQAILESPKFDAALEPTSWPTLSNQAVESGGILRKGVSHQLERLDLTIRHQWPPDFSSIAAGKLACILPWEHKAVPVRWIEEIEGGVEEVWTPSQFTRNAFVGAGLSPERIYVVPNAIDAEVFRPDGPATRPPNSKKFVFLFVGGCIRRKGIDPLLQAYADAFMPEDDVTLVIKDLGSRSFYSHNTRIGEVRQFAARRTSPHTIVLTEEMDDAALAALYRGANALVLPYRAEGFCMPLIEAMACGKPVLTTQAGPALEFCSEQTGYLIPAREVEVPEPPPPLGPLSSQWTWFEPSAASLAQTMRHVYENREEAEARGQRAAAAMAVGFTWGQVLPIYLERIERLTTEPIEAPRPL